MQLETSGGDLITRFNEGDLPAFDELFREYFEPLCELAWLIIKDQPAAEEIVMDKFYKLWQLRKRFNDNTHTWAFLCRSIRNACYTYLKDDRRKKKLNKQLFRQAPGVQEPAYPAAEPVNELELIHRHIEQLPAGCRQVFKLYYLDGLTTRQIALLLNIAPSTVQNQKTRARSLLRDALRKNREFKETYYQ